MDIMVRTLRRTAVLSGVKPSHSMKDLKKMLFQAREIEHTFNVRLQQGGRDVADDETVGDCGLQPESTLTVVIDSAMNPFEEGLVCSSCRNKLDSTEHLQGLGT